MPHTSMRPSVGWASPSSRRNIVVLPAPLAPTRPTRPRGHLDRQVVERRHTRVPLGETVDAEEGTGLGHTRSGKRGSVWLTGMGPHPSRGSTRRFGGCRRKVQSPWLKEGSMTGTAHAIGVTDPPLLEETIGSAFDRTVAAHPDHEALVVPFQDIRLTYRELGDQVDRLARGLIGARSRQGRSRGDVEPQQRRVGLHPVRRGEGRRDPGQHQPRVSDRGVALRARPVRVPGAGVGQRRSSRATTRR